MLSKEFTGWLKELIDALDIKSQKLIELDFITCINSPDREWQKRVHNRSLDFLEMTIGIKHLL